MPRQVEHAEVLAREGREALDERRLPAAGLADEEAGLARRGARGDALDEPREVGRARVGALGGAAGGGEERDAARAQRPAGGGDLRRAAEGRRVERAAVDAE